MIATGLAVHAQTLVLEDTFNSGLGTATNDMNYNLAGRQTGLLAPVGTYLNNTNYLSQLTVNGEFSTGFKFDPVVPQWEYMNANLAPYLANNSFSIKLAGKLVQGTADAWSSFAVVSDTENSRHLTPMGFFIHQQLPNHAGDIMYVYSGIPGNVIATPVSIDLLNVQLGAGFSVYDSHTYEIRAFADTATKGTYNFCVDGVVVLAGLAYEFSDSTGRRLEWVNIGVGALWDNVNVTTIPTPEYVFIDTFDTADTADINANLEARQASGMNSLAPYSLAPEGYSIAGNKMYQNTNFKWLWNEASLAGYINGKDFEFSAKITTEETGLAWTEIYLFGVGENQDSSRFAVLVQGAASLNACILRSGTGPSIHEEFIRVTEVEDATGVPYIRSAEHTFRLISKAGPGGTNTCTLEVDGFTMRSGIEYYISGSEKIRMGWVKTSSADIYYDDIYVKLIKGVTYEDWVVDDTGLTVGVNDARTDDPDTDSMDNLLEYALGGDPLFDDAASILPTSTFPDIDTWKYVYRRRVDDGVRGLAYDLQYKTNLITQTSWTSSAGGFEDGIGSIDFEFESVTNTIPITTYGLSEAFLKLEVTEN